MNSKPVEKQVWVKLRDAEEFRGVKLLSIPLHDKLIEQVEGPPSDQTDLSSFVDIQADLHELYYKFVF